jgi:FkbM family methyltransferase
MPMTLEETSEPQRTTEIPLWVFRVVPPRAYHRLRRTPVVGRIVRALFDAVLPRRGLVLTRVRSGPLAGMVLEVDPRTQIDVVVGLYEEGVLATIRSLLAEGDTAFDIGAHLGYFSLVMGTRVGATGRVVSFEPDPTVMSALQRNVKRNGAQTGAELVLVPAAVDGESGTAAFTEGRETSRGSLVSEGGDLHVEVMTLDDIVRQFGTPALVKIDVEGRELGVLDGATETLSAASTAFVIEAHSRALEQACVDALTAQGYRCAVHVEPGRAESYVVARPLRSR